MRRCVWWSPRPSNICFLGSGCYYSHTRRRTPLSQAAHDQKVSLTRLAATTMAPPSTDAATAVTIRTLRIRIFTCWSSPGKVRACRQFACYAGNIRDRTQQEQISRGLPSGPGVPPQFTRQDLYFFAQPLLSRALPAGTGRLSHPGTSPTFIWLAIQTRATFPRRSHSSSRFAREAGQVPAGPGEIASPSPGLHFEMMRRKMTPPSVG